MRKLLVGLLVFLGVMSVNGLALAAPEPELVSNTKNLLNDATTWIMILIPVAAGLMIGYQALMKQFTDDDALVAKHNRAMKNILIAAVIGISAVSIVKLVLSYFA
jgi:hypothetical protein